MVCLRVPPPQTSSVIFSREDRGEKTDGDMGKEKGFEEEVRKEGGGEGGREEGIKRLGRSWGPGIKSSFRLSSRPLQSMGQNLASLWCISR